MSGEKYETRLSGSAETYFLQRQIKSKNPLNYLQSTIIFSSPHRIAKAINEGIKNTKEPFWVRSRSFLPRSSFMTEVSWGFLSGIEGVPLPLVSSGKFLQFLLICRLGTS